MNYIKDFFYKLCNFSFFKRLTQFGVNELKKNNALLISGNGLSQLIPLLVYPLLTRLYSPEDFGTLALIFSIHSILITISTGRYESAIILPKDDKTASNLFSSGFSISLIVSFLLPFITYFSHSLLIKFNINEDLILWIYLLSITVLVASLAQLLNGWATRNKLFKAIVGYTFLLHSTASFSKLFFGYLGVKDGLLISFFIGQVLSSLYFLFAMGRLKKMPTFAFLSKKIISTAKIYKNFPKYNMPRSLLNSLSGNLPVFILTAFFSDYVTGQFSLAFALLFRPIFIYNSSVSQAFSQRVVELKNTNKPVWPIVKKFLVRTFLFSTFPAILLLISAPFLFSFVLGVEWRQAGQLCSVMVPWSFVVLMGGSIAFVPSIFFKQLQELIIDVVYLCLRISALFIGVLLNNVLLGIGLFSCCGVLIIVYQLIWYRSLLKKSDEALSLHL